MPSVTRIFGFWAAAIACAAFVCFQWLLCGILVFIVALVIRPQTLYLPPEFRVTTYWAYGLMIGNLALNSGYGTRLTYRFTTFHLSGGAMSYALLGFVALLFVLFGVREYLMCQEHQSSDSV